MGANRVDLGLQAVAVMHVVNGAQIEPAIADVQIPKRCEIVRVRRRQCWHVQKFDAAPGGCDAGVQQQNRSGYVGRLARRPTIQSAVAGMVAERHAGRNGGANFGRRFRHAGGNVARRLGAALGQRRFQMPVLDRQIPLNGQFTGRDMADQFLDLGAQGARDAGHDTRMIFPIGKNDVTAL